jgi:hypothetical protein
MTSEKGEKSFFHDKKIKTFSNRNYVPEKT